MTIVIPCWPYVYGSPSGTGKLRSLPEDFKVYEDLSFEPSGAGEHVFLQIQKNGENTEFIARELARFTNVRQGDIGYAGLKDRYAIATQWFSAWLPGKSEPDWTAFETGNIKVLQTHRHARKLKRGVLSGNRFEIVIRDWRGDLEKTIEQLTLIKTGGIANYYGEQRFGNHGQNVNKALAMFSGDRVKRAQRSLYLSAARSYLFNQILSGRIIRGTWNLAIPGDTFMFDRSQSHFKSLEPDPEILLRVATNAIHPTGALWGKGEVDVSADALIIEQAVIEANLELAQGLISNGVEKARRALRVNVENLEWQFIGNSALKLRFSLPAGSYATALLREIVIF